MFWPTCGDQVVASWMHAAGFSVLPGMRLTDSASALMRFFPEMWKTLSELSIMQFWFIASPPSGPWVYGQLCWVW